jgi:ketosteroid isomerase-like protein
MSEQNLAIILRGLELWNAGDFEQALELVHPDLEWRPGPLLLDVDQVYRGHEGLLRFWEEFASPFETAILEPARRVTGGDEVVVEAYFDARGREGVEVDVDAFQRYTVRDGKLARFQAYGSLEEALAAAGLA